MKVALLLALLFTVVLCRPARKASVSNSESSEEVRRSSLRRESVSLSQSSSLQHVSVSSSSDDSSETSEEQVAADISLQMKSESLSDSMSATASTSASTQSPDSGDSEDSDDDDDDDDEEEEDDETEDSESSESGEDTTASTATISPMIVVDDVTTATAVEEMTPDLINPTIFTDDTADSGRGDSLGSYPSEYKTIVYVEDKSYHKLPEPHKSWDYTSKKSAYEPAYGNEVHKAFKVYKGVQVHQDLLEEDTSTPEVESQSLDTPSGLPQDLSPRQASLDTEASLSQSSLRDSTSESLSDSTSDSTNDSSGNTEEEDGQTKAESISSDGLEENASTSDESPEAESLSISQSSEEATATPDAADSQSDESNSDESQSDEEVLQPVITTDLPVVITAK